LQFATGKSERVSASKPRSPTPPAAASSSTPQPRSTSRAKFCRPASTATRLSPAPAMRSAALSLVSPPSPVRSLKTRAHFRV